MLESVLFIICCSITVSLVWRFASKRHTLPCPAWLGWMVELDNPLFRNNRAINIISLIPLKPHMHILDFGCGPGRVSIPLAQKLKPLEGTVSALDIQSSMLERVRTKAVAHHLNNINYIDASLRPFTLEKESYDGALLVTVLGEIPHQEEVLSQIHTALKPSGKLYITEVIADPHFQRQGHIRRLAKICHFSEEDCIGNALSFTIILKKLPKESL